MKPTLRFAFLIALGLVIVTTLTLIFSSTVRAGVSAVFASRFNSASGLSAPAKRDSNATQVGDGNQVELISGPENLDGKMLPVEDVLAQNPTLKLPNVPASYHLQAEVQQISSGLLIFTWMDDQQNVITYTRAQNVIQAQADTAAGQPPLIVYTWSADGFEHTLNATDPKITVADLQAMQP